MTTITLHALTDLKARQIADSWHGGMMTGLYAFQSSGAVVVNRNFGKMPDTFTNDSGELVLTDDPDTLAILTAVEEIDRILEDGTDDSPENITDLISLKAYLTDTGPRGPVEGWAARLTW